MARSDRPDLILVEELNALERALGRSASTGRGIFDSGVVVGGILFSVLIGMLALAFALPRHAEVVPAILFTLISMGTLLLLPMALIVWGGIMEGSALRTLREMDLLRVQAARLSRGQRSNSSGRRSSNQLRWASRARG